MIPVIVGVSLVIFLIFAMAPGDALSDSADLKMSLEAKQELKHKMHLDEPKLVQYGYWASSALRGDLGESFRYQQPVTKVINTYIWNSFILSLASFVVSILIAIPIGVVSATKQYSGFDYVFTILALVGISIPAFFFAYMLIKWFAVDIKLFPVSGMTSPGTVLTGAAKVGDILHHMFLPFVVLTLINVAEIMRYTRSSMLEVIRQDYIRTARAKGLKEKVVIYKHALRNGLIPVITILGMWLPALFGGAIMTEQVFNWPGIGPITLISVYGRDYPLLMGINMLLAVLTLLGNLIADVTYALVDPRIRLR
jgi:peptide/nickel transport system permease protein